MKWRKRHTLGVIGLLAVSAFYVYFVHRSVEEKTANGWRLRYSYQPFHCRVCLGHVMLLTFNGRNVPIPAWDWNTSDTMNTPIAVLRTPVGGFRAFENDQRWRIWHGDTPTDETTDAITPEELARGWYDPRETADAGESFPYELFDRKAGTPQNWCLVATNRTVRWVRPDVIDKLSW